MLDQPRRSWAKWPKATIRWAKHGRSGDGEYPAIGVRKLFCPRRQKAALGVGPAAKLASLGVSQARRAADRGNPAQGYRAVARQDRGENGPAMADLTLAYMRKVFNWHAVRTEFRSPIVARTKPLERARDRVLTDDELRKVWRAAGDMKNAFGPFVRFTLLTATRREEAASMRRSELDGDLWVIPAARYKTKHNHAVPLSRAAQTVLQAMPVINGSDLVFTQPRRN